MQLAKNALCTQRPHGARVTDLHVFLAGSAMSVGDLWQRSVQRTLLRRAAQRYAERGWRVVPGAALKDDRYVCGPLCPTVSCHPAVDRWEVAASYRSDDVDDWWAHSAFSVLLATGYTFDVIEVPARIGAAAARSTILGPVAVAPTGRWMFLVEPGDSLRPELSAQLDVVLHGHGSWIPAPPTRTPGGRIRWDVHPAVTAWQVPNPYAVQKVLMSFLRPANRPATFSSRLAA
jgi:Bifunctional DNA primase/polymerase, N-terminal